MEILGCIRFLGGGLHCSWVLPWRGAWSTVAEDEKPRHRLALLLLSFHSFFKSINFLKAKFRGFFFVFKLRTQIQEIIEISICASKSYFLPPIYFFPNELAMVFKFVVLEN